MKNNIICVIENSFHTTILGFILENFIDIFADTCLKLFSERVIYEINSNCLIVSVVGQSEIYKNKIWK